MGYFVFCNDSVLERVKAMCIPMTVCAAAAGVALCITGWGRDYTGPQYLAGWLNCLYAWLMILAVMGVFLRWFDGADRFCAYMNRSSYGFYVLHYSIFVSFGYMLKTYTQMPAWLIYIALAAAVFALTPLLYEILRRIPLLRWAVLGENRKAIKSR
ncbi:MAG: acyltransferase family protein [Bacteroidales bacterium]|nr:acyltransferase family protein [Bacteroidales bacterium]